MKDYLEYEGFESAKSSKHTIRAAFQAELIDNAEAWMLVVEKRNLASHTYNQAILYETVNYIADQFFPMVSKLYDDLKCKI